MTAAAAPPPPRTFTPPPDRRAWLLVAFGLLAMFGPTFFDLFTGLWATTEQGHGPVVFVLSCWLIWRARAEVFAVEGANPRPLLGGLILLLALLFYVLGRSQDFPFFEVGALVFVLAGLLLVMRGARQLKAIWFALFFMLFMIPLPGIVVDMLTQPMKLAVSYVAEQVLFWAGYPIARTGVILQIGSYQLLVADACAGLHTLFTLEALGLLYLNVVRHSSALRNIGLAILIVPISFTANVIRVMALTLITYYFGYEAGQGFLHGFAGIVLFLSALMLIISADSLLRFGQRGRETQGASA
jgi:exosortase B